MIQKQVYKNPKIGQPLISVISTGCKTPILKVKFCNLFKPYYYANSPTIPRHSLTCVVDPEEHKEFLKGIQTIEKNESVETIIKNETIKEGTEHHLTGNVLIKFQSKDIIPIFVIESVKHEDGSGYIDEPCPIELEDELAGGEEVMVEYDILRYTKKNTMKTEHGISFKPSKIFYFRRGENGSN